MGCRFSKSERQPRPDQYDNKASISSSVEVVEKAGTPPATPATTVAQDDVLESLLSGIGLSQYVDAFRTSGYDDRSVLLDISEKDIADIASFAGVTVPPGHRKKIILASKRLAGCESPSTLDLEPSPRGTPSPKQAVVGGASDPPRSQRNLLFKLETSAELKEKLLLSTLSTTRSASASPSSTVARLPEDSAGPSQSNFDDIDSIATELAPRAKDGDNEGTFRAGETKGSDGGVSVPFSARSPYKIPMDSFKLSKSRSTSVEKDAGISVASASGEGESEKENFSPTLSSTARTTMSISDVFKSGDFRTFEITKPSHPASPSGGFMPSPTSSSAAAASSDGTSPASYRRTMDAIEASLKTKIARHSSTIGRGAQGRGRGGEPSSWVRPPENERKRSRRSARTIEESVRATEFQVKKKIADIIDRKWSLER